MRIRIKHHCITDDQFSIDVHISYDSSIIPNQYASLDNMGDFPKRGSWSTYICIRSRK